MDMFCCGALQASNRAGREVAELRAALDAAAKERAATSEQLAVLKTQMCFVLQVGLIWILTHAMMPAYG